MDRLSINTAINDREPEHVRRVMGPLTAAPECGVLDSAHPRQCVAILALRVGQHLMHLEEQPMKTNLLIAAGLTVALAAPVAFAQAPATPATPPAAGAPAAPGAAGATATFTLAAADQTKLKDWINMQKTASVPAPAGVTVAVGSTLPATITLYPIPASAGVTSVGMNQYAVIDNKIVLVDPTSKKIVFVLA
jgi:uncharacterized protein DUF1236